MRLTAFITQNSEAILEEFEEFARTHTEAGASMDMVALRDHAAAMLDTIALDMQETQSDVAQELKSKGDAPTTDDPAPTAAERHGADRVVRGFTLEEMFAEYRALRASVLRLWIDSKSQRLDENDAQDVIRFNEAIDQALAESITRFSTGLERSREMFLAILGHDLRTPLGAVTTAAGFLVEEGDLDGNNLTLAKRIRSSAGRMKALISDLIDFASARLGGGIQLTLSEVDVAETAREVLGEISGQHPNREFHIETTGDVRGRFDARRVSQALSNLLGNAVQHGAEDSPITIAVRGAAEEVSITIHSQGAAISEDDRRQIFSPFTRGAEAGAREGSIGLGLFIAQQIAVAHGGRIDVHSSPEEGTTFTLALPRPA